jgi:hypothetical protein
MTILHMATAGWAAEPVHAACPGDVLSVCGHELDAVLDEAWDTTPVHDACPRCHDAVVVLRQIKAV